MGSSTAMFNILLLVAFIALIYFMMIRPQKKRDRELSQMRSSLAPGNEIVTIGGITGKVVRVSEDRVLIETGGNKTKIEILKTAVGSVVSKGSAPLKESKKKADAEEDAAEETALRRDRKVTPKKLGTKKSTKSESKETSADEEKPKKRSTRSKKSAENNDDAE